MMAKKAPDGHGSMRKRADGRWEGRYTAGIDPKTGKQIQRSIYGKTQKEVREKLRNVLVELDKGTYVTPSQMTVSEWLDIWYTEYIGNTTVHTHKSYKGIVDNHIKPALGSVKLYQLDAASVQSMINGLQSTKVGGGVLTPKTVKNIHGVLHSALEQARRLGHIAKNPADLTILPRRSKPEIMALDSCQVTELLAKIKGHQYEWIYIVALFSGVRQSELMGLSWEDVNFDTGTLTIRRQLQYLGHKYGGYVFRNAPKNGKVRRIMPAVIVLDALRQQQMWQQEMAAKMGSCWSNEYNLVFTDPVGQALKHDHVYRHLKRIFAEIGIPDARFHDLRHTYAILSLQAGDDVKTVQDNLGHYSAAFTLDTYGHVTDGMKRASAQRMDALIQSLGGGENDA